ncbi:threonyl-tRNA synthetase [Paenibacillus shirakamiensis]|uniref:Threonine--tRNA ligase n=1 Tax=Paenibacillus shirakamiensis TaxID=1265935 RepID=A0ABS4JL28_9BACL|nr:threonine--tRNA ligase [Paenibacillus shirakamiensis]MBP2002414.1 threonyl-tRNA synthetase [Paenibacillus shirakamiensis]
MNVQIFLSDGAVRRFPAGTTVDEIAGSLSSKLRKSASAAKVNGVLVDLSYSIHEDSQLEVLLLDSPEGREIHRHSTAHLLAQAIQRIYGASQVKFGIGPVIQDGFYYDMDLDQTLSPEDLGRIEQEMALIVSENLPIVRTVVSREQALALFQEMNQPLKIEIIQDLPLDAEISLYQQGEFVDLCRGPHLPSTGKIKAFKLLSTAGAYWCGDAKQKMLQRVYGTAFPKMSQLQDHLQRLEQARARDHRKLGKELGLFMFSAEAPGMPFYLPKGMTLCTELEEFSRDMQRQWGCEEVRTPFMMNKKLWEQSGHWDHYKDNMYFTQVDEQEFALKPMNCPGHMIIYKNSLHSYRELPIRLSEFGQVHRHEFSGALNGMMRVRTFCQDDAHIFVRPDQIEEEIQQIMELIDRIYAVFGFTYHIELSTRPEDCMGAPELWDQAENALRHVLDKRGVAYQLNEGDGAFYGPKIDFHILDAIGRSWQCGTIQLDFQMPENFELSYIGQDNQKYRPVVIHRAIYGSLDRFVGILTEHYGGDFPLWLAPVQAMIVPVSEHFLDYALSVKAQLAAVNLRVEVDIRSEKLGYKIREANMQKIPYTLVVGEKEQTAGEVSVRRKGACELGAVPVKTFIDEVSALIVARK